MFKIRRFILAFICFLVVIEAIYYIFNLKTKRDEAKIIVFPAKPLVEPQSDKKSIVTQENKELTPASNKTVEIDSLKDFNPFGNGTFATLNIFTKPDTHQYSLLPHCNFSIANNDSSIYKVTVNQTIYSLDVIESYHGADVHYGGHYFPTDCQSEQRLAIIICYRNREFHLKILLNNIHAFLKQQKLDYTIFIVNQHGTDKFNRAALFNVGYIEAMKLYPYDCFIFHDVDLVPEDLRNLYRCGEQPRHMSVAVDKFGYRLLYPTLFGGVTAFNTSDFVNANGYPTIYWGWGGEDDDMYLRVTRKLKKKITRYPMEIARYKMIRAFNHTSSKVNPNRLTILYSKYKYDEDGLQTTKYQLHNIVFYKLFTFINVSLTEESFDQIRARLNIRTRPPIKRGRPTAKRRM